MAQDNVPTEGPGAPQSQPPAPDDDPLTTTFDHADWDRLWLSGQANFIPQCHQKYLAYGGYGFLLGDGKLNYGRENILESYYTLHLWRGILPAAGLQYMVDPGYNRDRGTVIVPTLRLNLEF